MTYTLLEGDSHDTHPVKLPQGQINVPCLIRDERDQQVILLVLGEHIPFDVWDEAIRNRVEGIYDLQTYRYIDSETFREHRYKEALKGTYRLPASLFGSPMEVPEITAQNRSEGREEASEPLGQDSVFVHLHTHSEYSALDGYSTVKEIVERAKNLGQNYVALTDHGWVSGHPELQDLCDANGMKPIFGMEAYLVQDRFDRSDRNYNHLILWALDDQGLKNLWAMSTEAHRDGSYYKPRLDYDTLSRFNKGIAASTGCLRGPLLEPYLRGKPAQALENLSKLKEIFRDRLYIEIQTNQLDDQVKGNQWLVEQARIFKVPLIAAVDSHYAHPEQAEDHQVWLAMQTAKDVEEESALFGGGQHYHLLDDLEVVESLAYLGEKAVSEAVGNTLALAQRCTARIKPKDGMPLYSTGEDAEEQDADRMLEMCYEAWNKRVGYKNLPEEPYLDRFEREAKLLIDKRFPGYFLMNADLVGHAKASGVRVGPGRGSAAGSLVAYLMGITEVDPVENDLLFERFMTEGRTALPDFDIDYPSTRKQFMIDYAVSRWGKPHVCAVGTHTRIKNRGAFRDTARAIRSKLPQNYFPDLDKIADIIKNAEASTAGLGLSWDELIADSGDLLAPYKEKMPALFEYAEKFRGRLKTYSRHAAGLVIDPNTNLEESLPMYLAEDGTLVTQFDKDVIEILGYVKFDSLNLRTLDTVQIATDLIKDQLGEEIDFYTWREEYYDDEVFRSMREGWTLGLFQIETNLGTRTVQQIQPTSIGDIADAIAIGRPGPLRSGLAATYFRRRNGEEPVELPDQRLVPVLEKTYGTMLYQEDIMAVCLTLANYNSDEADHVRKILGKKKKELVSAEGDKFVNRAVENKTKVEVAKKLWSQMEEFALYSFNRAHGFSYATLTYWTAWLKQHYPAQYITACLSSVEMEDVPDFVDEANRLGFKVLPPDINESREGFYSTDKAIRYGFGAVNGVGAVGIRAILDGQPFKSWEDFLERKGDCDMGQVKALVKIGAFDTLVPNRRALEMLMAEEEKKGGERCIFFQPTISKFGLPCKFDWDSEPAPVGRTGKPLKKKPLPKKCSRACRQFTQRPLPSVEDVEPYTDAEIRQIEMDMLGIYLSSSPFDVIDPEDLKQLTTGNEIHNAEEGLYLMAIMITRAKDHMQKNGKKMKFLTAATPSGKVELSVFSDILDKYKNSLNVGQLGLVEVKKNERGVNLRMMETING